jgi:outer membrane protein assembly factor BamB
MHPLLVALSLVAAPVPKVEPGDWKAALKDRKFDFNPEHSGPDNSAAAARKAGLAAEFVWDGSGWEGEFKFAKKDGPKITIRGHYYSVAIVRGDALYFADYDMISSGCTVVAYDLTTGKKAWAKPLEGIGPVSHSKYRNRVAMAVEQHPTAKGDFALVVTGWETAGAYVEVIDLGTGKQLANKKFDYETTSLRRP